MANIPLGYSLPYPKGITILIQKEVAERIVGSKKPTLLTWAVRIFGMPQIITDVSPKSFFPPPKVKSAIIRIPLFKKPLVREENLEAFFKMLSHAYKQPRKTLLNNLSDGWEKSKEELLNLFSNAEISPGMRLHQLVLEDWKRLFNQIYSE